MHAKMAQSLGPIKHSLYIWFKIVSPSVVLVLVSFSFG